jgi:hypothetical protein
MIIIYIKKKLFIFILVIIGWIDKIGLGKDWWVIIEKIGKV